MSKQPDGPTTDMERLRKALDVADDPARIQFAMESFAASAGIKMLSYYHYPPVGAVDFGPDIQVYTFGWPAAWAETYRQEGMIYVDPLPRVAAQQTKPFWWSEIHSLSAVDAKERAYLERASKAALGDGLAVPVFGPNGRNGYNAVSFGKDAARPGDDVIADVHAACQLAHLRFCEIILRSLPDAVSLSDRERQILGFVVRGNSNQMIAAKLNISANTVDTYVRRCFDKLDVKDRMSAGLRGLALGLVA